MNLERCKINRVVFQLSQFWLNNGFGIIHDRTNIASIDRNILPPISYVKSARYVYPRVIPIRNVKNNYVEFSYIYDKLYVIIKPAPRNFKKAYMKSLKCLEFLDVKKIYFVEQFTNKLMEEKLINSISYNAIFNYTYLAETIVNKQSVTLSQISEFDFEINSKNSTLLEASYNIESLASLI